jgi:diamine N-acetyltransferase
MDISTKITIIRAGVKDVQRLTQLSIRTFVDAFGPDNRKEDMDKYVAEEMNEQKLAEELADVDNLFFIARDGEVLAGYIKLRAVKHPEALAAARPMEIERAYVLKEYQNKKVGATLIAYAEMIARQNRHDVLWLGVWEHNYKAIRFYERHGFRLFGAHKFVLGTDVQTDVLMKKELT